MYGQTKLTTPVTVDVRLCSVFGTSFLRGNDLIFGHKQYQRVGLRESNLPVKNHLYPFSCFVLKSVCDVRTDNQAIVHVYRIMHALRVHRVVKYI